MSIYTYAVIDSVAVIRPVPGLFGQPVRNVPHGQIGVVVSELPGWDGPDKPGMRTRSVGRPRPTAERVLEHSAVTDGLAASFTVLPIRFSTVFPQEEDLLAHVRECYADFCVNLDRLRAKQEFGLRVLWPGETIRRELEVETRVPCARSRAGTAAEEFMQAKLTRYRLDRVFAARAEEEIAAIDHFFGPTATEKRYERLVTPNLLLSAYYLVEKARVADFHTAYQRLKHTRPEFKYLLSGPWPPYNFVVSDPSSVIRRTTAHGQRILDRTAP